MTLSQDAEAFRNLPADLCADVLNGRVLAAEAIETHRSWQREKAERIADEVLARSFDPSGGWREIVIAAALEGMQEAA